MAGIKTRTTGNGETSPDPPTLAAVRRPPTNALARYGWKLFLTAGLVLLTVSVVTLPRQPGAETAGVYMAIDTAPSGESVHAQYVCANGSLRSNGDLGDFPTEIGHWYGTNYDSPELTERIAADAVLLRQYRSTVFPQPVLMLIAFCPNPSARQTPWAAYQSLGYRLESERVDAVPVTDDTWIAQIENRELSGLPTSLPARVRQELEFEPYQGQIPAMVLAAYRANARGQVLERRVVLYIYVRRMAIEGYEAAMMCVSASTPLSSGYDGTVDMLKRFMGEAWPALFVPHK